MPLSELERLLILTAAGGNTGWHHSITRHDRYAPHLSNYPGGSVLFRLRRTVCLPRREQLLNKLARLFKRHA